MLSLLTIKNRRKLIVDSVKSANSVKKKEYLAMKKSMGIYVISNTVDGTSLLGISKDMTARLNRHRADLKFGSHRNKALQQDWKRLGSEAFEFNVVENLPHPDNEENYDASDDLAALLELIIERDGYDREKMYGVVTV
jgi:hypothetical protein